MNKIILYIATSRDSFIADKNGGVDWLPHPKDDSELQAVGYKSLISRVDTILMGSRSYEPISGFGDWWWTDKQTYVFTSKQLGTDKPYIRITRDTPLEFMANLKDRKSDKDIWLLGGAELAKSFSQEGLIDEIILTIVPQTLGAGISLILSFESFDLIAEKLVRDGIIQKVYLRKKILTLNLKSPQYLILISFLTGFLSLI